MNTDDTMLLQTPCIHARR